MTIKDLDQIECHGLTLEGLADVDDGRVVDHESVAAWAASLDSDKPLPVPSCD